MELMKKYWIQSDYEISISVHHWPGSSDALAICMKKEYGNYCGNLGPKLFDNGNVTENIDFSMLNFFAMYLLSIPFIF